VLFTHVTAWALAKPRGVIVLPIIIIIIIISPRYLVGYDVIMLLLYRVHCEDLTLLHSTRIRYMSIICDAHCI